MAAPDAPGSVYRYQDINLILMGEIVARLSGMPLDRFLHKEVFAPLGMKDTGFRPPATLLPRIAPTEALQQALLVDNPQRLYRFSNKE